MLSSFRPTSQSLRSKSVSPLLSPLLSSEAASLDVAAAWGGRNGVGVGGVSLPAFGLGGERGAEGGERVSAELKTSSAAYRDGSRCSAARRHFWWRFGCVERFVLVVCL